jgi:hypothetical protein
MGRRTADLCSTLLGVRRRWAASVKYPSSMKYGSCLEALSTSCSALFNSLFNPLFHYLFPG